MLFRSRSTHLFTLFPYTTLFRSKDNGLRKKSAADNFQVRSLSEIRFVEKIGTLTEDELQDIEQGLIHSLGLGS